MIKKTLTILTLALIIGLSIGTSKDIKAATRIVEYGATWTYGSYISWDGKHAYSNLLSTTRWHSSTASISGNTANSGSTQPGVQSRADRAGYIWDTAYSYYNIW